MSTLRRSPCWCGTPSHHVPVERPARAAHAAATGGTSAAHVLPDPGALPEARTARTQELPVLRVRVTQVHAAPRERRVPAVLPAPQEPREVTQSGRRVARSWSGSFTRASDKFHTDIKDGIVLHITAVTLGKIDFETT